MWCHVCDHTSSRERNGSLFEVCRYNGAQPHRKLGSIISYRKICFWPNLKGAFLSASAPVFAMEAIVPDLVGIWKT